MAQSIDMRGLDELDRTFDEALRLWPSLKQEALEEMGAAMLDVVTWNISASDMKNSGGPIPDWQRYYLGSRHGYVAVRAKGNRDGGGTGPESAGAITNYTENGHRIRKPEAVRRQGYHYRPRINKPAVQGYHYYYESDGAAQRAAVQAAEALAQKGAEALGGAAG